MTFSYCGNPEWRLNRPALSESAKGWCMSSERARLNEVREERELVELLRRQGISSVFISSDTESPMPLGDSGSRPNLALIDTAYMTSFEVERCVRACVESDVPSIALVPRSRVFGLEPSLPFTDFIASPLDPDELVVRARRILESGAAPEEDDSHIIRAGEVQIDTSSYEVTIHGRRIGLTFKEYELLKLLAENPGRVFSRYALLNQIWGYEYFGGTRTVDVHIRRLRSKMGNAEHNFIETIWNVGYRFREI